MSDLKEIITSYNKLSFSDRIVFYTTISNDIPFNDDMESFLIETRFDGGNTCAYCEGTHIVKNGKRKDGTQRYLRRDCSRSFIASTHSITSRTRKAVSIWTGYLKCMLDQKTLMKTSEECHISMTTAFIWRHKILDALSELTDKVYLTGTIEADETFFNLSYKGNHKGSKTFSMPREAHKRGNDVHTKGLSSEKVCVPSAVSDTGISYSKPAKPGKVSTECIDLVFADKIAPYSTLCTDRERAYLDLAGKNSLTLIQMDTDRRTIRKDGITYSIQRINAYHSRLKSFIRRFHGVSTKRLGNYVIWHDLISGNQRNKEEFFGQLLGHLLCTRVTIYGYNILSKPPLPSLA